MLVFKFCSKSYLRAEMQKVRRLLIESNGSSAVAILSTWRACHCPKPSLK